MTRLDQVKIAGDGSVRLVFGSQEIEVDQAAVVHEADRESLERTVAHHSARCRIAELRGFKLAKPVGDLRELSVDGFESSVDGIEVDDRRRKLARERLELLVDLGGERLEDVVRLLLLRLQLCEARLQLLDSIGGVSHDDWSLVELSEMMEISA